MQRMQCKRVIVSLCLGIASLPGISQAESAQPQARQTMSLQSQISGQRSQPKVLFILPWEEQLEKTDLDISEQGPGLQDFLAPVDRAAFTRKNKMYKQLENES